LFVSGEDNEFPLFQTERGGRKPACFQDEIEVIHGQQTICMEQVTGVATAKYFEKL
jgi:hypothetical protein